jgi:hypothetical protein
MNHLVSEVSYPVFLYLTFLFFLIASGFSFVVGVALAVRSQRALRVFDTLNRWVSVRRMMRPLMVPHDAEHLLMKRRIALGSVIFAGSLVSMWLLWGTDLRPALTLFDGLLSESEKYGVAYNLQWLLLGGNLAGVLIGGLILFSPHRLRSIETYTDRWYTLRKHTRALDAMHMEIDCWVLKHPTSVGIALTLLSLSVGMLMYNQMQNVGA